MEETIYYRMYQEELRKIVPCSAQEREALVQRLAKGDAQAKKRLVEGNLEWVVAIAQEYAGKGVKMEDLVAEGNLALALAVEQYREGDFLQQAKACVRTAIQSALEDEEGYAQTGENVAAMINVMNEVSTRLAEEYEREATVAEIARKMRMEEDQIRELMKMALSAASANVAEEQEEEFYLDDEMVSEENTQEDTW